jgi:hypothetical protein
MGGWALLRLVLVYAAVMTGGVAITRFFTTAMRADYDNAALEQAGDTRAIETRLQREIAAYNANLHLFTTPQTEALGASLTGKTVLKRYMMNRFVAPGERNDLAARLRQMHYSEVCPRQGLATRAGYRFVFSYADVVGGEIRLVFTAAEC